MVNNSPRTAVEIDGLRVVRGGNTVIPGLHTQVLRGVVTGLLAAPFGAIDWLGIPNGTRAKRIGAVHGVGNVVVVLLFAASWLMRSDAPAAPPKGALALSFVAGGMALITAWLGGELVDRLGVGVDDGAHLDAPSSLTTPSPRL